MAKYIACPCNQDGIEKPGTIGMLSGEYVRVENMVKFMVRRHGKQNQMYNVYRVNSYNHEWKFMQRVLGGYR